MKKITAILFVALSLVLAGCSSTRDILYFHDIDEVNLEPLSNEYEAVIKKDDKLTIIVTGPDKTVITPYNLTMSENGFGNNMNPERSTLGYLVDSKGNITFPILGTIHVEGMTRNELVEYLTAEIGKDVKDPIVYVDFRNYKITLLGEVRSPGTYVMESEKVNILQALSYAGDLTLTAKRSKILLLREENGSIVHHYIDLRDSHTLDSPYFFLQQNDIIYVPATSVRIATATSATGIWGSVIASISSPIALIMTALNLGK